MWVRILTLSLCQLLQYGIMADAYCRYILNRDNPTVGLLNIGEEEGKGTDFIKETRELLQKSKLEFYRQRRR